MKTRRINLRFATVAALLATASATSTAFAHSDGSETGRTTSGCGGCHGSAAAATTLEIMGPTSVAPGSMNMYRLIVRNSNATQTHAGVDIGATGGSLTATDVRTAVRAGEITHSMRLTPSDPGVWTIPFTWTAPVATGTVRINAASNAVNNNRANSGDQWNLGSLSITVTMGGAADAGFAPPDAGRPAPDAGIVPPDGSVPPAPDGGIAPPQDSGPVADAIAPSSDGGSSFPMSDASAPSDSGTASDASVATDGGSTMTRGGCGCTTAPTRANSSALGLALAALGAVVARRRRRA
jgi:MYXO-CTERM domain-containing protein